MFSPFERKAIVEALVEAKAWVCKTDRIASMRFGGGGSKGTGQMGRNGWRWLETIGLAISAFLSAGAMESDGWRTMRGAGYAKGGVIIREFFTLPLKRLGKLAI